MVQKNGWLNVNAYKTNDTAILTTSITEGYTAKIKVEIYNPEDSASSYDLVKQVSVVVEYKVGKQTESVQLNTTIVRN